MAHGDLRGTCDRSCGRALRSRAMSILELTRYLPLPWCHDTSSRHSLTDSQARAQTSTCAYDVSSKSPNVASDGTPNAERKVCALVCIGSICESNGDRRNRHASGPTFPCSGSMPRRMGTIGGPPPRGPCRSLEGRGRRFPAAVEPRVAMDRRQSVSWRVSGVGRGVPSPVLGDAAAGVVAGLTEPVPLSTGWRGPHIRAALDWRMRRWSSGSSI